MRCIACVMLSPRRVLLYGRVFCLSCVSGGLSYCVNVKRSVVMEMLGGRASQVFSAGAVVVTAAFACKRHGGARSQPTWQWGVTLKCMHTMYLHVMYIFLYSPQT